MNNHRYLSVAQAVEAGLWPNEGGLRWAIFNADKNGLASALRRVGRRVLIDEQAFHRWMSKQTERGA